MRAAAAVLSAIAFCCAGVLLRDGFRRRVEVCAQICLFFREVRLRARLHEPLDVQIGSLAQDRELEKLTFLPDCAARVRRGQPLPQAWTAAVETFLRLRALPRAQGEMLLRGIPTLSEADGTRVDGLLELYEARAAKALDVAARTDASVGGLCVRVCCAAGLALGILIM